MTARPIAGAVLLAALAAHACAPASAADPRKRGRHRGTRSAPCAILAADAGTDAGTDASVDASVDAGPPAWANAQSVDTDGVSALVTVPHAAALNCSTNFSISMWIKQDTSWAATEHIIGKRNAANTQNVWFMQVRNTTNNAIYIASSPTDTGSNFGQFPHSSLPVNQWNHLAVTYDGAGATNADKLNVYVNGSDLNMTLFSGTIPSSFSSGTADLVMMARDGISLVWGAGNIDEVTYYCITLSAAQVTEHWNSGTAGDTSTYTSAASRVAEWRFEGDYTDSVSTHDGTASGTGIALVADVP